MPFIIADHGFVTSLHQLREKAVQTDRFWVRAP